MLSLFVLSTWCRNINLLSIDYSLRPRLRCRLTPGRRTLPGKPYPYGDTDFNRVYRYSCLDTHFQTLHGQSPFRFGAFGTLAYRSFEPTNSVLGLSPDHFRRKSSRWVSYYALFKWWLPLSQHPHCLSNSTSFPLSRILAP